MHYLFVVKGSNKFLGICQLLRYEGLKVNSSCVNYIQLYRGGNCLTR